MVDFNENQQYLDASALGERMKVFRDGEGYKEFKAIVLDKIKEEAFNIFDTLPADDQVGIIGTQQMKKVVDYIEGKIDGSIDEGRLCLDYLRTNSNQ